MIGPVLAAVTAVALLVSGWFAHQAGVPGRDLWRDAPIAAVWVAVLAIWPIYAMAVAYVLLGLSLVVERWRP